MDCAYRSLSSSEHWLPSHCAATGVVRVHSRQSAETYTGPLGDIATGWAAYPTAVLWSLARRGLPIEGIDLAVDSSVPVGAGLSSSAALTCSVALAVNELHDSPFDRDELVQVCIQAENDGVGAPTGGMDQTIALFAQPSTALLLDCQDGSTEPIPFELHGAGYELIVIDTRVKHSLADGQYGMRRSQCVAAAAALGVGSLREATAGQAETVRDPILRARARHVVTEIERTRKTAELLRSSRFSDVGELFDNSHASLRDDFEVSCEELDVAVAAARRGWRDRCADDRRRIRRLSHRAGSGRKRSGGHRVGEPRLCCARLASTTLSRRRRCRGVRPPVSERTARSAHWRRRTYRSPWLGHLEIPLT